MRKAADGGPGACLRCGAALLPARPGSGAWRQRRVLVPCVVRRHGQSPASLQFETGAGCYERLSGADPERVPRHATGNARGPLRPARSAARQSKVLHLAAAAARQALEYLHHARCTDRRRRPGGAVR